MSTLSVEVGCLTSLSSRPTGLIDPPVRSDLSLWRLFRKHCGRLLLAYGLLNVENLLGLMQPLLLGNAISGLLKSSPHGLILYVALYLLHLMLASLRRVYDARVFTNIHAGLAVNVVLQQRARNVDVSRIAARSTLSREFANFFRYDLPVHFRIGYSLIGALVMLALQDGWLAVGCLVAMAPLAVLNQVYSRKLHLFNGQLHDQYEQELDAIGDGTPERVRRHYGLVACWQIRLSDWEALNFGLMEVCVLALLAVMLLRVCTLPGAEAGQIYSVFRYVVMFVQGLDGVPMQVQQLSRLRDIGRRLREPASL